MAQEYLIAENEDYIYGIFEEQDVISETKAYIEFREDIDQIHTQLKESLLHPETLQDCIEFWQAIHGNVYAIQQHKIGAYYPNKGIYAGNVDNKDIFVALYDYKGDKDGKLNWKDAMNATNKNGYHLPTQKELTLMYLNKDEINASLKALNGDEIKDSHYWSSTEISDVCAWGLYFVNGNRGRNLKISTNYVRSVMSIPT